MSRPGFDPTKLTPELLLRAYAAGIFPMSEARDDPGIFWVDPEVRGILPLEAFHVSKRLRRTVRSKTFEVSYDTDFQAVIRACAETARGRPNTWINDTIIDAYTALHRMGFAHSVEVRLEGELAGGLYGVSIGGAFCGESMFSNATDASKVALVHLVARLRLGGYLLLDVQFVTDHLKRFGAIEIPARDYLERLDEALQARASFNRDLSESEENESLEALLNPPFPR